MTKHIEVCYLSFDIFLFADFIANSKFFITKRQNLTTIQEEKLINKMLRVVNLLQNNTNSPQIDEFKLQNVIS